MVLLVKWTLLAAVALAQNGNVISQNTIRSGPEVCARACDEGEPPKTCYYHFTAELYDVLGAACQVCSPNATNVIWSRCQCVLADGVEKGILTINRMIPGPSIQVCEGDEVIVDLQNYMEGMEVTIHWHGIRQRGTQYYDGVPFVTQCPIQQGNTFRYRWTATNAGTHLWYAHTGVQKMDGLYGSIVVRQPPSKDANSPLYNYDLTTHVILLSDWFHENSQEKYPGKLAVNPGQVPDNVLINGRGKFQDSNTGFVTNTPLEVYTITPCRRYRFRMINSFSSACPVQLSIEGHELLIIATDGEPVEPVLVNTIISFSGERYDFVIEAHQPVGAYWIQVRGLGECVTKKIMQLGILRYANGPYEPGTPKPTYDAHLPEGVVLNPLDAVCNEPRPDAICINQLYSRRPIDKELLQKSPVVKIGLPIRLLYYRPEELFTPNTYKHYFVTPTGDHVIGLVNGISFVYPTSPPLSQIDDIPTLQFCNGDNRPADCGQICTCTHKIDIPLNAIVEVVLVNQFHQPNVSHPLHLHGHVFNVIGMGPLPEKFDLEQILDLGKNLLDLGTELLDLGTKLLSNNLLQMPVAKDTIAVPHNGYVVLRFRADNPGYWLFNSQFLFNMVTGVNTILHVGKQEDLPPVPLNFPTCGNFFEQI